jgi:hypothetical protein
MSTIAHSSTARQHWRALLRNTDAGILLNKHVAEDGPTVFAHACRLGAEGICLQAGRRHLSVRVQSGSRSAILRASRCSGGAARIGIGDPGIIEVRRA